MSKPLQVDNSLSHLFTNNRQWAQKTTQNEPSFFSKLAEQQSLCRFTRTGKRADWLATG